MKNFLANVLKSSGKARMVVKKYSPELWMVAGAVSGIGTIVLATRAGLKAEEVLEEHKKRIEMIKEAEEISLIGTDSEGGNVIFSEKDAAEDKMRAYAMTAVSFGKLYSPVVAAGSFSLACFLVSNRILKKRYLGTVSALNAVTLAFHNYRENVKEEVGEDADYRFRHGIKKAFVDKTVIDKKGKETVVQEEVEVVDRDPNLPSEYARFFDSSNENWDPNPEFNLMFLKAQESMANHILHTRGHIFLNEVYEMLGFEHTSMGQVAGWVEGNADDYVDFGLTEYYREGVRRFVNGKENVVLLDFNIDGSIWDKI